MPNNFDLKNLVLTELSALKSINYPKLNVSFSFPSLNGKNNILDFLIDLLKIITGYDTVKKELVVFLTSKLGDFESRIKELLKSLLKAKFSCSIDAKIPDSFINGIGVGFNVAISQIDFFSILKINPNSVEGNLIYEENIDDLNRVLYEATQTGSATWKNLLIIEYLPSAPVDGRLRTNVFRITVHPSWQGKTINDFFNVFFQSINLFTTGSFVNRLFDSLWGSISSFLGKSKNSASTIAEAEIIIDKIIDLPDTIVDDSYYDFEKTDYDYIQSRTDSIIRGYTVLEDCNYARSELNISDIIDFNSQLQNKSTYIEIKTIFENKFDSLVNQSTNNISDDNRSFGNFSVFLKLFRNIIKGAVFSILSPKVILMIVTYLKFLSINLGYSNFQEFVRLYRALIVSSIRDIILPYLTDFIYAVILRELNQLLSADAQENIKEQIKYQKLIRLSLIGVPDLIRNIISSI